MRILFVFFLLISINNANSQNLVPNASFEDTISCPFQAGQINYATGWLSITESPDYFNVCGPAGLNIPNTGFGYQYANDGNAMAGFVNYSLVEPNVREYFGIQLSQPLNLNQTYFGSFKISLADNLGLDCGTDKMGMKLTTNFLTGPIISTSLINNDSKIYSSNIIDDKVNWVEIKGSFVADSAYQYIWIGNFFSDQNTSSSNCLSHSYYFIDSVCISEDSIDCYLNTSNIDIENKLPFLIRRNFCDDYISIEYRGIETVKVEILNSIGKRVNNFFIKSNLIVNVSDWPTGMYFVRCEQYGFISKIFIINL